MTVRISGKKYIGNGDSDALVLDSRTLAKSQVDLGSGLDTLTVTAPGDLVFSSSSYMSMKGVDILDFSRLTLALLTVTLSDAMVAQSDARVLTLLSGTSGIDALSAPGITSGKVVIGGTGDVMLANGVSNTVFIGENTNVQVYGGTGSDTITASSSGSCLDGGGGADRLVAGSGSDTVTYGIGDGADTVVNFNPENDALALTGLAFASLDALAEKIRDTSNGAIIDFGGGNSILFQGITKTALSEAAITVDGNPLLPSPSVIMVGTSISAATLNDMIAIAKAGVTFVLSNGVHAFDQPLVIARSDITLKGESESGTILRFSFDPGSEADAIQVAGGGKNYIGLAQGTISAGASTITLPAGTTLVAGNVIYLYQPNTQDYLTQNGWTNVAWSDADQRPFREFIVEIDHIENNIATLSAPLPYTMDAGEARIFRVDTIQNVTLSDFTVTYNLGPDNPYDFINTQPASDGLSAIQLSSVASAALQNITVKDAASNGISLTSSIGVVGTNLTVDGALNKGGDGNGYGLLLTESFSNDFSGLTLLNGRHAVVFSAWSAETYNVIQVDTTNRDINFHGSPDIGNSVSVDRSVLDYNPALDTSGNSSIWSIVSAGGLAHAATDIYGSNDAAFHFAVASSANDEIRGTRQDDYLNGAFGYDSLSGGLGNDYLVGGTRKDTLTGGDGSDTFLLRMGDDLDTITDFTFGAGGDRIIFSGNAAVTGAANLVFTQNGADLYVRYGSNSTVILKGHTLADVDISNFAFDPGGAATANAYSGVDFIL